MPDPGPSWSISPAEWQAQIDYDSWNDPFTPDDGIALHHGGGSDYRAGNLPYSMGEEMAQLRGWERYHLSKGWRGLAYGWGLGQTGSVYRIRGWNRYGAHLGDIDGDGIANNDEIIPVIFIGSGFYHELSPAAQSSLVRLRRYLVDTSGRRLVLRGHQEIAPPDHPTSCPGPKLMDYVRNHRLLEAAMEKIPLTDWARPTFQWLIDQGLYTEEKDIDKVRETYEFQQQMVITVRLFEEVPTSTKDETARRAARRVNDRVNGIAAFLKQAGNQ